MQKNKWGGGLMERNLREVISNQVPKYYIWNTPSYSGLNDIFVDKIYV